MGYVGVMTQQPVPPGGAPPTGEEDMEVFQIVVDTNDTVPMTMDCEVD